MDNPLLLLLPYYIVLVHTMLHDRHIIHRRVAHTGHPTTCCNTMDLANTPFVDTMDKSNPLLLHWVGQYCNCHIDTLLHMASLVVVLVVVLVVWVLVILQRIVKIGCFVLWWWCWQQQLIHSPMDNHTCPGRFWHKWNPIHCYNNIDLLDKPCFHMSCIHIPWPPNAVDAILDNSHKWNMYRHPTVVAPDLYHHHRRQAVSTHPRIVKRPRD